jgi:hypothetical protein
MSVVAKMNVSYVRRFNADCSLVALNCVCDEDLQSENYEDRRFTKYSPSGEATIVVDNRHLHNFRVGEPVYVFFHSKEEGPALVGAVLSFAVNCASITEYGGTGKEVNFHGYSQHGMELPEDYRFLLPQEKTTYVQAALKMLIDNPNASMQFSPGQSYYLSLYGADNTLADACRLAAKPV